MTNWCSAACAGAILRAPIDMLKTEETNGLADGQTSSIAACRLLTVAWPFTAVLISRGTGFSLGPDLVSEMMGF